jgi:hypothetical protein
MKFEQILEGVSKGHVVLKINIERKKQMNPF